MSLMSLYMAVFWDAAIAAKLPGLDRLIGHLTIMRATAKYNCLKDKLPERACVFSNACAGSHGHRLQITTPFPYHKSQIPSNLQTLGSKPNPKLINQVSRTQH